MPVGTGLVKSVRTGHPVPGTLRIVFDLAAPVMAPKPRMEQGPGKPPADRWPGDGPATAAAGKAAVPVPAPDQPSVNLSEARRATAALGANAAMQAAQPLRPRPS
jgi:N-acetylmuramoyl-L-alanine amidase